MLFFIPHPLVAMLDAIEKYLKVEPGEHWQSFSYEQKNLIKEVYGERFDLRFFNEKQLKSFAGESAAKLNTVLQSEGFDIRLGELGDNGVGSVAIMRVIFSWISEALKCSLSIGGSKYAAMKFKNGFTTFNAVNHDFPVIRLEAMGYEVFVSVQGDKRSVPINGFALKDKIDGIMNYAKPTKNDFDFFKMPAIKAKADIDVSWMLGLKFKKGKRSLTIQQAKEQIKLEMDEKGVKAEVAAAMGTRGGSDYGLTINEPFYLYIKKAGIKNGVLYGLIDENCWIEVPK